MQTRALVKSLALHAVVVSAALVIPAGPLRRSAQPDEVDVVFHRPPPPVEFKAPVMPPLPRGPRTAQRSPAPPAAPAAPAEPLAASTPGVPEGLPEAQVTEPPKPQVGKSGILAF